MTDDIVEGEVEEIVQKAGLTANPAMPFTLSLSEARGLANVFVKSGLFADTKDLAQATVKILAGYELGIGPFAAMRGINIIQGQLAPNAAVTGALIKKTPGGDYRVTESTTKKCTISFLQGGEEIGTITWTMEDATLAGLANKQNWKKWPRQMLFSRALTEGARQNFPHIFMGSVYIPEELGEPITEGEVVELTRDMRGGHAMVNWPLDEQIKHADSLVKDESTSGSDLTNAFWSLGRSMNMDDDYLNTLVQENVSENGTNWRGALRAVLDHKDG